MNKMNDDEARTIRDEHVASLAPVPFVDGTVQENVLPEKVNPALPDHVWQQLQTMGEVAVNHLGRLLVDKKFPQLSVKEQMRVIETAMNRAYGSIDGSIRRNLHIHGRVGDEKGLNAMTDLAQRATRSLPEFKRPYVTGNEQSEDMKRRYRSVEGDTLDAETCEDIPGDGNKV